jgi:hypothetical protein
MTQNNDTFFPSNYSAPSTGGADFMKFQDGENRFRILTAPVIGWEGWKDGKPFRREETVCSITPEMVDVDTKFDPAGKPKINHFWAFAAYNYAEKKVQILELTQKTIMAGIQALANDTDWGDPRKYDLNVTKVKQGDKTTYTVMNKPHKELSSEVKEAFEESDIDPRSILKCSIAEDPKAKADVEAIINQAVEDMPF